MAADITDKLTDVRNAARPNSARVSAPRSAAGNSLTCDNLVGWPTASKVHFVTYSIDTNSDPIAGTQLDCYGIVSGNTIGSFTVIDGSDTGNTVGDVVEMLPTAAWGQDLADWGSLQHSRLGAHKNISNTGGMSTDTLTVSGGTTLPAGDIGAADLATDAVTTVKILAFNVTTAKIADDAVTDAKLIYGKLRSRLGGSATNWITPGTTTYDYSATNTFMQAGTNLANASPTTITFPTAFNQVPVVVAILYSAIGVNCYISSILPTATNFSIQVVTDAGVANNAQGFMWIAIGE